MKEEWRGRKQERQKVEHQKDPKDSRVWKEVGEWMGRHLLWVKEK